MKKLICIVLTLLVVALANTQPAYAVRGGNFGHGGGHFGHSGGHVGVGVFLGPGFWGPGWWGPYPYYPYYPYYNPQVIVQEPQSDIYVQPAPQQEGPHYWYFCTDPQGYYPNVKKCPKGWMKVIPPANPPEEEE